MYTPIAEVLAVTMILYCVIKIIIDTFRGKERKEKFIESYLPLTVTAILILIFFS